MADSWITVNGRHILVKDGESVEQALNRTFQTDKGNETIRNAYKNAKESSNGKTKKLNDRLSGNTTSGNLGDKIKTSNPKSFRSSLQVAKHTIGLADRWRVDLHDEADYKNDRVFTTKNGSCVAIEPNGNIISVCKANGDDLRGSDLLKFAVENGGDRLDAFGEGLYKFYTKNGFEPVSWTPFNKEYAPDEWKEAKNSGIEVSEEPVIFYKHTGNKTTLSYNDFLKKVKPCEGDSGYDDAQALRDKELK